jgi:hypothetical protein
MVWLGVEQEWKVDGRTPESEDSQTGCWIKKEAVGYVTAGSDRAGMWIKEGWTFVLRITLENKPEVVRRRQETLKRMGVYPRLHVFLHCWIEGIMLHWRIYSLKTLSFHNNLQK